MSIFSHIKKIFQTNTRGAQLDKELMSRETLLYPTALFTPYNPDTLASRKGGLRIYDKIRRDDTVKGCMNLRKFAVLCSGWVVEPASDDEADIEVAEFVKHNLERVKGTFEDVLLNIMTAFDYGFSVSEKVYTLLPDTGPYGGKVGVKAIKTRKPHGVDFDVDEFGNLRENGVWQGFGTRKLPPSKFIIYTYRKEFDNWYGISDLREAYRSWWSKDVIIKLYNIYLERYSMPPAVGTLKKALTKNERTTLKNILDNLQARTSIVLPDGVELNFPEVSGRGASTYKDAIAVHDMAIARSLLIPNLLGVSEQGHYGSYSQGKVHFDVFLQIVDKHRRDLEEVLNEQLIRELVSFNYAVDKYPKFKFRPMDEEKRQAMAKLFIDAVEKGVIAPTLKDENKLRQHLGWPEREEEEGGGYQLRSYTTYFRPLSPYERKCQFERIQRYLDQLDRNSVEKITGIIKQQRDWLIDFVSKRMEKGELHPTLIQKLELKYGGKLQEAITEMLRLAFYEGRKEAEREIGKKHYKRLNPFAPTAALEWLKSKGIQTKEILNSQLRFKVQNILMESLKKGVPLKETIQKIQQTYQPYVGDKTVLVPGAAAPYRIETLVRTSTTAAYNHGRVSMMQQAGDYVPAMEFSAILDSRTTEICRKADGKVIPKNDPDMERFIPPLHHNCFLSPKTPVLTDKGYKPIKDIKVGDKVLTHLGRYMPVTFVHHRQSPTTYKGPVYKVMLGIGEDTITLPPVTPDHPVLATPGWVPVKRLEVGDRVTVWRDGGFVSATVIAVGVTQMKYHRRLYNLSVGGDESYVANGVVVHNCRSLLIPVTRDDMMTHPFTPITRQEKDELLALIPEEFGGRVGGPSTQGWKSDPVARLFRDEANAEKYYQYKQGYIDIFRQRVKPGEEGPRVVRKLKRVLDRLIDKDESLLRMERVMRKWQADSLSTYGTALRMRAFSLEKGLPRVIYPSDISRREMLRIIDEILTVDDYLRLRALNQAYMEVINQGEIILYRGTDGGKGKRIRKAVLKEGRKRLKYRMVDNSLAGYTDKLKVADFFGAGEDGVTVRRRFAREEVIVHRNLLSGITGKYADEREWILRGIDDVLSVVDDMRMFRADGTMKDFGEKL